MTSLKNGICVSFVVLICIINLQAGPTTHPEDVDWGQGDGRCRIGLKDFPTTVSAGNAITGTVVIQNTGTGTVPIMMHTGRPVWQIGIEASMLDGTKVAPTSYARVDLKGTGSFMLNKLGPSQSLEIPINLTRLIDMTQAGGYQIRFTFTEQPTRASSQPSENTVSSKVLRVDVEE